jgi:aldose sugar dehydrogenase
MKSILKTFFYCLFFVGVFIACKKKESTPASNPPLTDDKWPTDSVRTVAQNLSLPWEILWGKDDNLWITERPGRIRQINPKTGEILFTHTITEVVSNGEGGLLGMVQHPDFLSNGYLYVVYNYNKAAVYTEKVVRFTFSNNTLTNPITLLDNIPAANIHNGSRLLITDNKLFITTGDAANTALAQNTSSLAGKILRINLDGSVPADNPIAGNPVWSWGHRNPQGMVLVNNIFYTSEHGPNIEDEVNIVEKGRNYGWPNVNGPCDGGELSFCTANNIRQPIFSSGSSTLAYCGLEYYNNARIPQWSNSLLLVTLKDQSLRQLKLSNDGLSVTSSATFFKNSFGRLRDACVSPAGRVYLCTGNGSNDRIIEIQRL